MNGEEKLLLQFVMGRNNILTGLLLQTHKARTDKIRLLDVANEFVQRNKNCARNFSKFTDLDLSTY